MQLTEKERDLLVEELARATAWGTPYDLTDKHMQALYRQNVEERLMPIIDLVLADRAVPEPDADAVERAAKAICDVDRSMFPDYVRHIPARTIYLDRARAALSAVPEPGAMHYYTATSEMYDVSTTIDTEPRYSTHFDVLGGPFKTLEDAAETAGGFAWILGFKGVDCVSIHSASLYELDDGPTSLDDFDRPNLGDFLHEIVQGELAHRKESTT